MKKKVEEYIPEHGGQEKELMFFTYGEEEEEEEEEERSLVHCEIKDSRLFIEVFYRLIIKY